MKIRTLKPEEIKLITWMIKDKPEGTSIIEKLPDILVQEMDDGGMGSLRVLKEGEENRLYGGDLAQGDFLDSDGIPFFIQ